MGVMPMTASILRRKGTDRRPWFPPTANFIVWYSDRHLRHLIIVEFTEFQNGSNAHDGFHSPAEGNGSPALVPAHRELHRLVFQNHLSGGLQLGVVREVVQVQ